MDTGLFNLVVESRLHLTSTEISGIVSKRQAVLNSKLESNVTITDDVSISHNHAINNENGSTLNFDNSKNIEISRAIFNGNTQTNIKMSNSERLILTKVKFRDCKGRHIDLRQVTNVSL